MRLTHSDVGWHEVLSATAFDKPERVAIVFEDRSLTFAVLE